VNKAQAEVINALLDREREIESDLRKAYKEALEDITERITVLSSAKESQSKIYQIAYQKELERQVTLALKELDKNAGRIEEYLKGVYQDSYVGVRYALNDFGIGIVTFIDEKQLATAVFKKEGDFLFSDRLYSNMIQLKTQVKAEIARGISQGSGYVEIARQVSFRTEANFNQAIRIARTEGHRIQTEASLDSASIARERGADIVKVWDATLDSKTRDDHAAADQQVREEDEQFEVGGYLTDGPGLVGIASEDINCRCAVLHMPRWAVDEQQLRRDNETGDIIECKDYKEYKEKYLEKMAGKSDDISWPKYNQEGRITTEIYKKLEDYAKNKGITLNGFAGSDVDIRLAESTIDDLSRMMSMYPELSTIKGNPITLFLDQQMHPNDFAYISRGSPNILHLNANAYRSVEALDSEYTKLVESGWFVAGSDYHHIVYHEVGHLWGDYHNLDDFAIAQMALEMRAPETRKWLSSNLSEYSVASNREIISEVMSAQMLEKPSDFVLTFFEICNTIIKSRGKR
jgi:uncharacterized protein with gpF-like domain